MNSPLSTTLGARMSAYLVTSNDFKKQRFRVNKQLKKLRHELGLINSNTKKYESPKLTPEQYNKDKKFGLVYLLLAERDILYGLEIKNLMEIDEKLKKNYKNLMITKFKRSLDHAVDLLELTKDEESNNIKVELYTYTALVAGQLFIIQKKWSKALNSFSIARCCLDYLYDQPNKDKYDQDVSFSKTLFTELSETLVDPSLKLAINQLDLHYTTDLKSISRKYCHDDEVAYLKPALRLIGEEYTTDISSNVEVSKEISWRNHEAVIYNDEVAYKISNLNNNLHWDQTNEVDSFDSIIAEWLEVLNLHKLDTEKNQDDDDLEQVQNRAILLTYINYNLLFTKLKRDVLLIGQLAGVQDNKDAIRLYNGIIAIVQELKDLPGVYNDDDLYYSLGNLEKYFVYKKYQIIAESYQFKSLFGESLKIYRYIDDEISIADEFYKTKFPFDISNNEQIALFRVDIKKKILQNQISAQFELSKGASNYTLENINKFPKDDLSIINLSKIEPIMAKPVLFDIAFNYISYDLDKSATSKAQPVQEQPAQEEAEAKKRGLFGFFGRN
ncbi:Signal recognition particle subunit SRP68 [Candida viswanathii]|uniref:Signal recognition particle subunit SRP68 n=1 Tax=Candida viswanathii TaxID=5486 RepID=A0A367YEZ3_9ASCO|nr:Signal recognition particle subunit SRP68 [Candida viswanathii]